MSGVVKMPNLPRIEEELSPVTSISSLISRNPEAASGLSLISNHPALPQFEVKKVTLFYAEGREIINPREDNPAGDQWRQPFAAELIFDTIDGIPFNEAREQRRRFHVYFAIGLLISLWLAGALIWFIVYFIFINETE